MQKKSRLYGWMTAPAPSVSRLQRQWLTHPGALTQGLRTLGVLTLRVLSEKVCRASLDEATRLGLPTGHALWQREVCMAISGVDCVMAHSVTPLEAAHGYWQAVRRLRNRPLADILYHDPTIVRSDFEFTNIRLANFPTRVCARRSVFVRARQPLLVAEAFLPVFWSIALGAKSRSSRASL